MVLVAGVIDTTSNYVEHPEVVADRLDARGRGPSATRAASSPAPTAASTRRPGIGDVAPSLVWEKLRALRAGADLASRRLF